MGEENRVEQSCSSVVYHIGPAMRVDEQPILVCRIDTRRCHPADGHARDGLFLDSYLQTLGQGIGCRYGGLVCCADILDPFLSRLKDGASAARHIWLWRLCNGVSERFARSGGPRQCSFPQNSGFLFRQCLSLSTDDRYQQRCGYQR